MSGFANGKIILDEVWNFHYAGQVLSGKIEFGLSQPMVFKAINVEFHGEATVEWTETTVEEYDGCRRQTYQDYTANEDYFHVVQTVCGGVGLSQLPAGDHSIPFRYQIPPSVPSTFYTSKGSVKGSVSYYIRACLQYADGREQDKLERAFEVIVPLDMNMNPAMKQPICMEFEETVSSLCCGSGLLAVQVKLPASGFCPGQAIPVEINANNQSSIEIFSIKLELVRRDCYHSTSPQSDQYLPPERLEVCWLGAILPHTKRTITTDLVVPDMVAPVLDNCRIMDVEFYFKVKMKLSGCNDHLEDKAQIYLGLVPLAELQDGPYTHPLQRDLPAGPIPNLNAQHQYIPPYVYPSVTLQNNMQSVHVQNVSNYPGSNAYPGQPGTGYPANNYPPGNAPYPVNPPYPANGPSNGPYPGINPAFPGTNPPYPGANQPYAGANTPYPGVSVANPPYPTTKLDNAPHPTNPSTFIPSPAGFKVPGELSPGYPMSSIPSSPYNPSAPPAPTP